MKTRFHVIDKEKVELQCHYCELKLKKRRNRVIVDLYFFSTSLLREISLIGSRPIYILIIKTLYIFTPNIQGYWGELIILKKGLKQVAMK